MDLKHRVDAAIDAALWSRIVGCVVLIHRDGRPVYGRAAGFADREAKQPVAENTIFRLASVTKPIVASTALVMLDKGLLSLDDPVTRYLPWFTPRSPDGTKPPILIRQLLTHTSGLTYDGAPADVSTGSDPGPPVSLEENLKRLAQAPLSFAPGSRWDYGTSIDVLGAVLGAINGNPSDVEAVVSRHLTGPLAMTDTHFHVTDKARLSHPYADGKPEPIRMAEPQEVHNDADDPDKSEFFSPARILQDGKPQSGGSGMAGTAPDFIKLLDALQGSLLKPATRDAAFANQIAALPRDRDPGQKFGFLGAVIEDTQASGWPVEGMLHWGGIWGNNWILDPTSRTTVVVMTNTMREGCNGPFREEIRDAVFQ